MTDRAGTFGRTMVWALPVWAALLFVGTLTHQPDPKSDFAGFAQYVTTTEFLVSHLVASILGAAIGSIGVVALAFRLQGTRTAGRMFAGMMATVTANTLLTAIFGAAAFAQTAIGRWQLSGKPDGLAIYNEVYGAPLFGTAIVGLLFFIAGGMLVGLAIAGCGQLPRWAGWLYAVAAVLFAIAGFAWPEGQTVASAGLIVATVAVAVAARRPVPVT